MKKLAIILGVFLLVTAGGCAKKDIAPAGLPPPPEAAPSASTPDDTTVDISPADTPLEAPPAQAGDSGLQVIIFDVGQADCILLKTDTHSMLIDAGNIGQDELILGYLSSNGISRLDYIVATHPHADHIGAMAGVIRGLDSIGAVLMPDVIHTTRTFENLLDAIEERDVPLVIAAPGDKIALGGLNVEVLAPNSESYRELNDYSVVLRAVFGQVAFLFTGDAEAASENEQLSNGLPLQADVLKVGHHGSRSSSAQKYLEAVAPRYAVISLGGGNSYGHPHEETMGLAGLGIKVFRTDLNGTVSFTSDGETIAVNTETD